MRLRRALWHALGPTIGRRAPGLFGAYYAAVVGSLIGQFDADPAVRAVYAYGSYADGVYRPGVSDVDLLLVLEDLPIGDEVAALERLGQAFRRRQALLPIDVTPLLASELPLFGHWLSSMRFRIADGAPLTPPAAWTLVAGEELRGPDLAPADPRLAHLTDAHIEQAIRAYACARREPARQLASSLDQLVRDLDREQLHSDSADRLRAARREAARASAFDGASAEGAAAVALGAALGLIEEQRRRIAVPLSHRPAEATWQAERPATAPEVGLGAGFRSATVVRPAASVRDLLLLELDGDVDQHAAREALRLARSEACRDLDVQLLTSAIAEDGWRTLLRTGPLLASGVHLSGDPLAPRIAFPEHPWLQAVALQRALSLVAHARRSLLGWREGRVDPTAVAKLELWAGAASAGPVDFRLRSVESRGDRESHAQLLERWRSWPAAAGLGDLVHQQHPFSSHARAVE